MDLPKALERTVRGLAKPSRLQMGYFTVPMNAELTVGAVITQCSIRHLYNLSLAEHPKKSAMIDLAKTFERRLCGHHELENPLPEKECIESAVIVNGANKHRYCVATQSNDLKESLNEVPGVPIVHIHKSVMILEKVSRVTEMAADRAEKYKFKMGIRQTGLNKKRKRDEVVAEALAVVDGEVQGATGVEEEKPKKKKKKGPKGPNPLAVKKKKSKPHIDQQPAAKASAAPTPEGAADERTPTKKKRSRKHGKVAGEVGDDIDVAHSGREDADVSTQTASLRITEVASV